MFLFHLSLDILNLELMQFCAMVSESGLTGLLMHDSGYMVPILVFGVSLCRLPVKFR